MVWYAYLACFFASIFLVNGIPHFIHGISGKKFRTPFAKPMGKGESSPVVNVVWGVINFLIGYALVFGVGQFGFTLSVLMLILGGIAMAVVLALSFGRTEKVNVAQLANLERCEAQYGNWEANVARQI